MKDGTIRFYEKNKYLFIKCVCNNRAECVLPEYLIDELATCLLPDILAFCESEKGKKLFKEWKKRKAGKTEHEAQSA